MKGMIKEVLLVLTAILTKTYGSGIYYTLKDIPKLNESTSEFTTTHDLPPLEFPYANATGNVSLILNSSSTDIEVPDLLKNPTVKPEDLSPNKPKIIYNDVDSVDNSIELIEDEGNDNTEDVIKMGRHTEKGVALVQGQMAAILAGVFAAIAIVGYVGLMTWRKYLEKRYSGREMLVNEFEFNARDDNLKYFSI